MNKLSEDYFSHRIKPEYQTEANILLATTGVLNSISGNYKLFISSTSVQHEDELFFDNIQRFNMTAIVIENGTNNILKFEGLGSPNQCYEYIAKKFELLLEENEDSIYLIQHDELTMEDFISSESCKLSQVVIDKQSSISGLQQKVDEWINILGVRYFSELTNLSNLIEEVGEVARLIGRVYGEQSFKEGEKPECIKTAIADELSDVLFIVVCLANQLDINLDKAFVNNMNKKTKRDITRHKNNSKLK